MKRIVEICILLLTLSSIVFASFNDVKNETYANAINCLVDEGILNGYEDGTFRPDKTITRAEIAKVIVLATDTPLEASNIFLDVDENHWACKYISAAADAGFILGDGDGNYRPDDNITYGEAATIIVRAMGYEKEVNALDMAWPNNFMQYAINLKLFDGVQTNDLVSIGKARRDNVALMIYNMLFYTEVEEDSDKKIDTKTAYAGIVKDTYTINEQNAIIVEDYLGTKLDLKIYKQSNAPIVDSFIAYQFKSNGEINLRKEIKVSGDRSDFYKVSNVEKSIITLEGLDTLFDLDFKEVEFEDRTIKLAKYNYIILEIDKDEKEFTKYSINSLENLELRKDDIIRFENDVNLCIVIREKKMPTAR